MTVLSDQTIRYKAKANQMIVPFNEDQLQPCSYDVTLGDEIYFFTDEGGRDIDWDDRYIDGETKELYSIKYSPYILSDDHPVLNLKPGELIIATTNETINLPDDIAGTFMGKSSLGRIGLSTHVTAGFIDPGFKGTITLEIVNMNHYTIKLHWKQKIGQIIFNRLNLAAERPYGSDGLGSHYQNQKGATVARG